MNVELLEKLGQIAGIAGLSIGLLLLIFRPIIAKVFLGNLTKEQAYKIIRLIIIFSFTTAIIGILGWFYLEDKKTSTIENNITKNINFTSTKDFPLIVTGNGVVKNQKSELIIELDDIIVKLDTSKIDNYEIQKIILTHSYDSPQGYKNFNISKAKYINKSLNKNRIDLEIDDLSFKIPFKSVSQIENSFFVLEIYDEKGYIPAFTNQL